MFSERQVYPPRGWSQKPSSPNWQQNRAFTSPGKQRGKHEIPHFLGAVTAAVTANGRFTGLGFPQRFPVVSSKPTGVALVSVVTKASGYQRGYQANRLPWRWYARRRYASWYAQKAMAQAMQVQAGAIRYLFEQYARARATHPKKRGSGLNQTHGH